MILLTEKKIVYFDEISEDNTEPTLKAAKERTDELSIKDIIVSSTRGGTTLKALDRFRGSYNVIVVTHSAGFKEPVKIEMSDETEREITARGGRLLTTLHALAGVDRAINKKFGTLGPS